MPYSFLPHNTISGKFSPPYYWKFHINSVHFILSGGESEKFQLFLHNPRTRMSIVYQQVWAGFKCLQRSVIASHSFGIFLCICLLQFSFFIFLFSLFYNIFTVLYVTNPSISLFYHTAGPTEGVGVRRPRPGVYKEQKFGRGGGGKINSYFDLLGKINSICPLNTSNNRDFII